MSPGTTWVWVPVVIGGAVAQTARNAAQRSLVAQAGTLGATLVRFLFGIPFVGVPVLLLYLLRRDSVPLPPFSLGYFGWLLLGALAQLAATAFMLAAMKQRNFVIGIAYSKTDALQVALFESLFLATLPGWATLVAMALATAGVILLSVPAKARTDASQPPAWAGRAALLGLASGAGFALSAVGYRGAALQMPGLPAWLIAAWGVLLAQTLQSVLLGGWLTMTAPQALRATFRAWRTSLLAGGMGTLASLCWFIGFVLTTATNVRTLGMVEVIFSYLVSHRLMRERLSGAERSGLALVAAGLLCLGLQS